MITLIAILISVICPEWKWDQFILFATAFVDMCLLMLIGAIIISSKEIDNV